MALAAPPESSFWYRAPTTSYPVLEGEIRSDVCVVGLGGSGLACIDELLSEGVAVVGLDAATVGSAAAGRNGGLLRAGTSLFHHEAVARYGAARASHLYSATVAERERLLAKFPAVARRAGYLRLAHDGDELRDCRRHLEALQRDGFPASWYEGKLGSGVLVDDDAVIDPLARCRLEAADVSARGVRLFERSRATTFSAGKVETTEGVVHCSLTILAIDGKLGDALPELADRVWPTRLQVFASGPHPAGTLPHALGTRWGWDYGQQLPGGRIVFGGCRDVGGDAERTADTRVTPVVQAALERRFTDVLGAAPQVTHRWSGTGGYTADGLPVLAEIRPGVWATGGYCGTGNLFGAACGRHVVRRALGRSSEELFG